MKGANIGLWLTLGAMAYIGWIVNDMSEPPKISGGGASALAVVRGSTLPVLVEFYADWCGPCKIVGPEVEKLADELSGKARVIRINIDEHPDDAQAHSVRAVPTFIAFQAGRETARRQGGIPRSQMRAMLGL